MIIRIAVLLLAALELRIHCTTIGQPHRNGQSIVDNAVLILHGSGTGTGTADAGEFQRH